MPKCSLREYTYNYECVIYLKTKHGIRFNRRPNTPYVENGRRSRTWLLNYCTRDDGKTFERLIFRLEILRIKNKYGKRNRKKKVLIVHSVRTGSVWSFGLVSSRARPFHYLLYRVRNTYYNNLHNRCGRARARTRPADTRVLRRRCFTCLFPTRSKFPVRCDDAQQRRNHDNNRFMRPDTLASLGQVFWRPDANVCARLSFSPRHFRFRYVRVECPNILRNISESPSPGWPVWKAVYAYV